MKINVAQMAVLPGWENDHGIIAAEMQLIASNQGWTIHFLQIHKNRNLYRISFLKEEKNYLMFLDRKCLRGFAEFSALRWPDYSPVDGLYRPTYVELDSVKMNADLARISSLYKVKITELIPEFHLK